MGDEGISKLCNFCKTEKPISSFSKNKGGKYGVRATCKTCETFKMKMLYNIDREAQQRSIKKYQKNNKDKCLEFTRNWRRKNLAYDAFRAKIYRTRKQNQFPPWANIEKIKEIYLNCPKGYHVDHIIPLKGTHASGLHVEANLQYLTAKENMKKRNLYGW